MVRQKFHHGSLRAELLTRGVTELERCGYENLSLRDLALDIGVTAAAPYRHFANKEALLSALADSGMEDLRARYRAATTLAGTPENRLRAACRAYLDFAAERPQMFRLIFASDIKWCLETVNEIPPVSSFGLFEGLVRDNLRLKDADNTRKAAVTCWCIIHGYANLRMNGRIEPMCDASALEAAILAIACQTDLAIDVESAAAPATFGSPSAFLSV